METFLQEIRDAPTMEDAKKVLQKWLPMHLPIGDYSCVGAIGKLGPAYIRCVKCSEIIHRSDAYEPCIPKTI